MKEQKVKRQIEEIECPNCGLWGAVYSQYRLNSKTVRHSINCKWCEFTDWRNVEDKEFIQTERGSEMKIISYKNFVERCHSIIYDYCGRSSGIIYESGYQLNITFNVGDISLDIWLYDNNETGYSKILPEISIFIAFDDDEKINKELNIIQNIGYALKDLITEFSQYLIDLGAVYGDKQIYEYEWNET